MMESDTEVQAKKKGSREISIKLLSYPFKSESGEIEEDKKQ